MNQNERITALAGRLDGPQVFGFADHAEDETIIGQTLLVSAAHVAKGDGAWSFMGKGLLGSENAAALERLIERRWIVSQPTIMDAPEDVVRGEDGRPRKLVLTDKLLDDLEEHLDRRGGAKGSGSKEVVDNQPEADHVVKVWRFADAPEELRALWGDRDGTPVWIEKTPGRDAAVGCWTSDLVTFSKHFRLDGSVVRIGAHA